MWKFIGMFILALKLGGNLKGYGKLFKKNREKSELKLREAYDNMQKEKSLSNTTKIALFKMLIWSIFVLDLIFYGILAGISGHIGMYVLGLIIVLILFVQIKKSLKEFKNGELNLKAKFNINTPITTVFLVLFIILLWVV